jgi:hypothetical protein
MIGGNDVPEPGLGLERGGRLWMIFGQGIFWNVSGAVVCCVWMWIVVGVTVVMLGERIVSGIYLWVEKKVAREKGTIRTAVKR